MNLPQAFLVTSAAAYLVALVAPLRFMKTRNVVAEKAGYLLCAVLLLSNTLLVDSGILWVLMGVMWVAAAMMSYVGISQWNVRWRPTVSDAAQVFMAGWDLAISVACFLQV